MAELLKSICVHGKGAMKYDNVRIGVNSRLDTLQAAILDVKFKAFRNYELRDINEAADKYTSLLRHIVKVPMIPDDFYSSWAQYTIQLKSREERDGLQGELKKNDIPSMVYYPKPLHKQQAFAGLNCIDDDYMNSLQLCDTVLSLPIHPYLKDNEMMKVVEVIERYITK